MKDSFVVVGTVEDLGIHSAQIVRNGTDSEIVSITAGKFSKNFGLLDSVNTFRAVAKDSSGATIVSSPYVLTRLVNHSPTALITIVADGTSITLSALNSTDPDSGQTVSLTFAWSVDPNNPQAVPGVDGSTSSSFVVTAPTTPGEYLSRPHRIGCERE